MTAGKFDRWWNHLSIPPTTLGKLFMNCIAHRFRLLFFIAFTTGVASGLSSHVQTEESFSFSQWKKGLNSSAFQNCRILVKLESYRQTSDNQEGTGERVAVTQLEILRRKNYSRITETVAVDKVGVKSVSEHCFTNQYLHLEGNNSSDTSKAPVLAASGCLDVKEALSHPADDSLGSAALVFGITGFSGDWRPRLAEFEVASDRTDPTALDFGPFGKARVLLERGVPREIEHSYNLVTFDKFNKIDRSRRNSLKTSVIRFSKIQWKSVGNGFLPVSYTYDQYLIEGGKRKSLMGQVVTLEHFEMDKEFPDKSFLPINPIENGTTVTVSDLPIACEWRNNRIEPVLPTGKGSLVFEASNLPRIVVFLVLTLIIGLVAFFFWRRSTSK